MINLYSLRRGVNILLIKGFCEAFALGGLEAEREERAKYKKEQEDAHLANHIAFREMINRHRIDEAERLRAE